MAWLILMDTTVDPPAPAGFSPALADIGAFSPDKGKKGKTGKGVASCDKCDKSGRTADECLSDHVCSKGRKAIARPSAGPSASPRLHLSTTAPPWNGE